MDISERPNPPTERKKSALPLIGLLVLLCLLSMGAVAFLAWPQIQGMLGAAETAPPVASAADRHSTQGGLSGIAIGMNEKCATRGGWVNAVRCGEFYRQPSSHAEPWPITTTRPTCA